jgi:hypothetical protein
MIKMMETLRLMVEITSPLLLKYLHQKSQEMTHLYALHIE